MELIKFALKSCTEVKLTIALNGKTIRSFSREIGVSHSYLSQILNGLRNPSAITASKLASGLNKDIEEIFLVEVVDNLPNGGGKSNDSNSEHRSSNR